MDDDSRSRAFGRTGGSAGGGPSGGTELIGGVVFLLGCLPAAALLQAWIRGTDLTIEGLRFPAAIAAAVHQWVGTLPGLVAAVALTLVGAMMIVGTLRTNPLHGVAGVLLSGVGLAVVASAIAPATLAHAGAGGRIGDSTAGELHAVLGVLLGLVVMGAAIWLCFGSGASEPAVDEDGFAPIPEDSRDAAPRNGLLARVGEGAVTGLAALKERRARRKSPALGASNESPRRIQPRRQRRSSAPPATLGDAMARRQTEGVSHDEAAALAPDDKALEYMQSVWKNATESFRQVEPVPPSPYPEDPRLQGQLPPGTRPLDPAAVTSAQAAPAAEAGAAPAPVPAPASPPAAPEVAGHAADPFAVGPELDPDVAPFDFEDAQASVAELPLAAPTYDPPAPPRETFDRPEGVRPITPADTAAQPTEVTLPPQPTWETPLVEDLADELGEPQPLEVPPAAQDAALEPEVEPDVPEAPAARLAPEPAVIEDPEAIPEVDTATGRWPRRDDVEAEVELDVPVEPEEAPVAEAEAPEEAEVEAPVEEAEIADEPEDSDEADEPEEVEALDEDEGEEEVEYEYVDEDGNPVDPEEIDGEWETVEEDGELAEAELDVEDPAAEADEEWEEEEEDGEEAELEEEDEDPDAELEEDEEEVEYEYVDEDGNPIDPADLEDGEWEEVDEEDVEEEDEHEAAAEAEVVLEPQAPPVASEEPPGPAAAPAAADAAALSGDAGRLLEAGLLVVREGRVAVSLLQREFGCEFEEACALLDELQREGLIGPYKGGKARDILLTEPEWESRFARS